MYHLVTDKDSFKSSKFQFIGNGQMSNGEKNGLASQDFENGCTFVGNFVDDQIHGKGKFCFPEGSSLEGFFENNHFRQGVINLSVGVSINCLTMTDSETNEDFLKEFSIKFRSSYSVKAVTNEKGNIENAVIMDKKGDIVARYKLGNLVFKLPDHQNQYIVVSKLWVYEGGLYNYSSDATNSIVLDGDGVQIWYMGIGYYKGHRVNSIQDKVQMILRHSGSLQFFREIIYNNGRFVNAITVFNNGILFMSKDDYFKGTLKFFLANGSERETKCSLTEYSILKSGNLQFEDDDCAVKFSLKNGRLMFSYKNKDLTLDEFKEFVLMEK
jgi:hypothetical protein